MDLNNFAGSQININSAVVRKQVNLLSHMENFEDNLANTMENFDIEDNHASSKENSDDEEKSVDSAENIDTEKNFAHNMGNVADNVNNVERFDMDFYSEGIDKMIRFLSRQKQNFTSLLQKLETSTESYKLALDLCDSIQRSLSASNQRVLSSVRDTLMRVDLQLRPMKFCILHIEDAFQFLEAIVKSTSEPLESIFPNHARRLVHTLEKTERDVVNTLNTLLAVTEMIRAILTDPYFRNY